MPIFSERLEAKMTPWATDSLGMVVRALGAQGLDELLDLIEEEGDTPVWGKLLDPDLCPRKYLRYPAMFAGVEIPEGLTEEQERELIKNQPSERRGRQLTIEEAIRMSGITTFTIIPRQNEAGEEKAYHFLIVAPAAEITAHEAAAREAINKVKPAGVFYTFIPAEGSWIVGSKSWEEVAEAVTWENVTEGEY